MSKPKSPNANERRVIRLEKKIADDEFMAAAIGDVNWLRQSLRANRGALNFDKNGLAPIHLAAIHGRLECLKLLIDKFKVDVNLPSTTGWRPIHLCISNQTGKRALSALDYLLLKGANPSAVNDDGITPMHQAASEGHVECLKALIEANGKVDQADARGHKPIDLAKLWGHRQCARILAAETWHQNKDYIFNQMKELKKVQMQQVLEEIEAEMEAQIELDYSSSQAYRAWLESHGLSPTSSIMLTETRSKQRKAWRDKQERDKKEGSQEKIALKGVGTKGELTEEEEMAQYDNLVPPLTHRGTKPLSPAIMEETSSLSDGPIPVPETSSSKPGPMSVSVPDTKKVSSKSFKDDSIMSHLKPWNFSNKPPPSIYLPNLQDAFPRDEYTRLPVVKKIRKKSAPKSREGKATPNIDLPADVIMEYLNPTKVYRSVVYKAKAIEHVQNKRIPDPDKLHHSECGLHLSDDVNSYLFQLALLKVNKTKESNADLSHKRSEDEAVSDVNIHSTDSLPSYRQLPRIPSS